MIISFLLYLVLLTIILGYSALFKSIIFNSKNNLLKIKIYCSDFIYGLFFIIISTLIFQIIFPLKYLSLPLSFFGILLFIVFVYRKSFVFIRLYSTLIIIFLIIFINSLNSPTYDTQLYHHQLLNWNYNYNISLNLVEIDYRMGMASPWQVFLSLGNLKINNSLLAFLFNFLPIFLFVNLTIISFKKKPKIPDLFLIFNCLFIIIFSLIHPFKNGIIMMHLGSLGTEFAGMIFFILTIYYYLKYLYDYDQNCYCYIFILSILTIYCRISYLPVVLIPLSLVINIKNFSDYFKLNIIILTSVLIWLMRSVIINGCLIYPLKFTCLNIDGYLSSEKIEIYSTIVKSFARTAPNHQYFMDLNYSIESLNWFLPWLKNYFFTTSLTQIFTIFSIIFLLPFILNLKKYFSKIKIILIVYFFSFIIWLQAPDIRFALGLIVSLPVFFAVFIIKNNNHKIYDNLKFISIAFFFLLVLKNYENLNTILKSQIYERNYNYENFVTLNYINKNKIVKNTGANGFCYDIEYICITNSESNLLIEKQKLGNIKFKRY